ncbi:excinuclease ABC subunit UvrA [Candidatus Saccharibacteria bacterium]|nr:excinuclease ABC subunit UvrA [Candidatus Saccharibacteria bacterium]MBR3122187.1 excinuclease ABC subunit UvrA [Candidatus Saccharibacteria bacterium]
MDKEDGKEKALEGEIFDTENVIRVRGARQNNLKDLNVDIPRDKLVIITGLSGSGKSSLAFDTIYAEGQRRYVESLSSYARMFLGVMDKPEVDSITGLSPAISIDQKSTSRNPRSTVATVTEVYDYLRLLFARVGVPHCPICHKKVSRRTVEDIINEVMKLPLGSKCMCLAPIVTAKKGEFLHIPEQYTAKGFSRVRVDGIIYALDEFPELNKNERHDIEIVVDRFVLNPELRTRIAGSIEQALEMGQGIMQILIIKDNSVAVGESNIKAEKTEVLTYSQRYACPDHPDELIPELTPRLFSFNAPEGACPECTGLGSRMEIDPGLVFNNNLTIAEGGIRPFNRVGQDSWWLKRLMAVGVKHGFNVYTPIGELSDEVKQMIMYGTGDEKYEMRVSGSGRFAEGTIYQTTYEGVIPTLERRYNDPKISDFVKHDIERFMRVRECQKCHGVRLKPAVLAVTIHGLNIVDMCNFDVDAILEVLDQDLGFTKEEEMIAEPILKEIKKRVKFMQDVGLGYLELGRAANTLSGGEAQRIRLATQIGSGLTGVLYVLDEPSIGLHQRDNDKLIATLKHLRDLKNTVLVVEHDEETMLKSDYIIDIGPGAGVEGGRLVACGTPEEVMKNPNSITGKYLSGELSIPVPKKRRKIRAGHELVVRGARENNLKNIDVHFPLGVFTVVSGVSGSGKSTLVNTILANELLARLHRAQTVSGTHDKIEGIEKINKAIVIDQSPIGRTPRSNPATYTGVFTAIRELFAAQPEAQVRGYKAGRFSFNVKGGRCEHCQGDGVNKIEMHFLPDVYVTCPECHGKRYNREALEIKYKGKDIADVLDMTIDEAVEFFANIPAIVTKLKTIKEVGLGYIKLGQSATTFSGGEAQRIKLATELSRRSTGKTLYILDEPTTGLHSDDVKRLLAILNKLVEGGNTIVVIEHNLDVIKSADWIIDMGPEGGLKGGQVIAEGTPEQLAKSAKTPTGEYLKKYL